jgi:hypothetical protein
MPGHFMRDDAIGVVLGTILFTPFMLAPGYLFAWVLNLFSFRVLSRGWRLMISLAISVAAVPIVIFCLGTFLSMRAVWGFYALATIFLLAMELARPGPRGQDTPRWVVWTAPGWAIVMLASGIDLQFRDRLYPPVLAYDFNLRTEVVQSLARNGLPAVSPFFFPGHAVGLRYHYFWFVPCALVERLGGSLVGSRAALVAGDVWCGWALMVVAVLFLRYFAPAGDRNLRGRSKWVVAMLAVAGLDLLPNLFDDITHAVTGGWFVYSSAEWWNTPVTAFPHAVLFGAHNVAGLLACLVGFLLLWQGGRYRYAVCAGLCFASSAGLAIYVSFTFAIFLAIWGGVVLVQRKWKRFVPLLVSTLIAVVCAAPYLWAMRQAGSQHSGSYFVRPAVRGFTPFDVILPALGWSSSRVAVADFLVLPLNYFFETGLWFVLALLWWRRVRRRGTFADETRLAALLMFGTSLLVATFLRSGVIDNNDLGWRSILVGQFILLIWAVDPLRAWWRLRAKRRGMVCLVALGLASTFYDFVWMRIYIPLSDTGAIPVAKWFGSDTHQGERTLAAREVYEQLSRTTPPNAVLQENPNRWNDVYLGLYGLRQTAAFSWTCGSEMGGDARECEVMQKQLTPLFNDPTDSRVFDIDRVCDAWHIQVLVAKDDDPVFANREAWPWQRTPLVANDRVRAIGCGARP